MADVPPWLLYNRAIYHVGTGTLPVTDDTDWHIALCGVASNAADPALESFADLTDELETLHGYTQGGAAIGGQTWEEADGVSTFRSDGAQWMAGGELSAAFAVYYLNRVSNGVDRPVLAACVLNGGALLTAKNDLFAVAIDPAGLFTMERAP